ncbi:MAG: hypothetical protein V5A47_02625 [Bacteroidales bacterium]
MPQPTGPTAKKAVRPGARPVFRSLESKAQQMLLAPRLIPLKVETGKRWQVGIKKGKDQSF